MAQESPSIGRPEDTPRVKTVACMAGVSLERGVPADEIHDYIRDAGNLVWVDVQNPQSAELAMLEEEFGFHPLALEGVAQGERRPRADDYKGYMLLVTYAAVSLSSVREHATSEVDLFIGRNYLVSVHRHPLPALDEALARWTRGGQMLREGVGFLLYCVLDAFIDSYVPWLERVEDSIEEAEIAMFTRADEESVRSLLRQKRALVALRRVLFPLREVYQTLLRRDHPLLASSTQVYLRDVHEHLLRILDVLDTERELAAGALEASLTISSNRLNNTMKTLAVITAAVAFVGSVFGAYGMNFDTIPLKEAPWGFGTIAGGTILVVIAAGAVGWWRKWW